MRFYFFLFFIVSFYNSNAQLETNNWFLNQNRIAINPSGVTTGLTLPANFPGSLKTTSISDAAGNLLFAFNGATIIDRNLAVMPSVANINMQGNGKMLIQQIPGSSSYYVFYTRQNPPNNVNASYTIKYAIVDLTLNNGNGDVIIYDQDLNTNASPGFTVIQGDDPSTAWLVTHRCAVDSFYSYKITNAGINMIPVKSRAGTNATIGDYIFRELKTSFDGKMIAGLAYRDYSAAFATTYRFIEVFNFNVITGQLTYKVRTKRTYGYFYVYFSLEFSPDNRLLYSSLIQRVYGLQPCGFGNGTINQYNLCYTDSTDFGLYSTTVATDFQRCLPDVTWGEAQMGADKRIHMPFSGVTVSTINHPNRIGSGNGYIFNSYQLPNNNNSQVTTSMFNHKMMEKAVKNNIVYTGSCHPNPIFFKITNDTIINVLWNFGDPASPNNTSNLTSPTHIFSAPGLYTVSAQLYNSQNQLIETVSELIEIKDPDQRLLHGLPADTAICEGGRIGIRLQVVNGIYHWFQRDNNGEITNSTVSDSFTIQYPGKWYVEMKQNDCNGCTKLDSINVTVLPKPSFNLGNNRNLCAGDSLQLIIYENNADYIWSTGETTQSIWVRQGGLFWAEAEFNNNGCPFRDSITITSVPGVSFSLPPDVTLCSNETLLLNPGVTNANYLWQNGSTQTTFTVTQPGTYWVKITSPNACSKSDTIIVDYINTSSVYLGRDTALCAGSSLLLGAGIPNAQYTWSTGATSSQIIVTQPGSYWVKVDNGTCVVSDTINITFDEPPVLFLGNDMTLCKGEQLLLDPGIPNASYKWKDGSTANTFTISQPGSYWVEVKQNSCIVKDTITISYYIVPAINLGADFSFCTGDSAVLDAGPLFTQYNWNNGSPLQKITVYNSGEYVVTGITADGCKSIDTIRVLSPYLLPVPNLGVDGSICKGDSRTLDAGTGFREYIWNTGFTTQTISVSSIGSYSVMVTDQNGCKGYDTLQINSLLSLPANFLPVDTTICSYGSLQLKPISNYNQYRWNTGSTLSAINITQPGLYWLQVRDNNNCLGNDSINVRLKECLTGLYVPSGFTPNKDGKNDLLRPLLAGNVQQYKFQIYNRAGQLVFQTNDLTKGWDGKIGGIEQGTQVLVWICQYQFEGEPLKIEKGIVTIIR